MTDAHDSVSELAERIGDAVIGQDQVVQRLILGLLANGNILLEGLPGLAKTRAVKTLAREMAVAFSRIQFTPDLLPADITGSEVLYSDGGTEAFRFEPGPLFGNIVLADEINRAPAKVQSALLEAMEERQITVSGKSHKMPDLFMVMATQNPVEQEGTYPLPEAQLDRFLLHVFVGYASPEQEAEIVRLVRGETAGGGGDTPPPIAPDVIFRARREIDAVRVDAAVERYLVDLVFATRQPQPFGEDLAGWIQVGASPRGSIGLDRTARAHAWLAGRDYVTPEDVREVVPDVLRHRLILSYEATAEGITPDHVLAEVMRRVAVA